MRGQLCNLMQQEAALRGRLYALPTKSSNPYARLAAIRLEGALQCVHRGAAEAAERHLAEAAAFIHYADEAATIARLRALPCDTI
jgi:hypothetical protein